MTAENGGRPRRVPWRSSCFNEAAADDRGKLRVVRAALLANRRFNEAAADDRGKLRLVVGVHDPDVDASMRPRPMTAENKSLAQFAAATPFASMRPRPMTAENSARGCPAGSFRGRFNEAAADDRGKRHAPHLVFRPRNASMRPRPMTAENPPSCANGTLIAVLQ